jgi:hypothetical protein
MIVHVKSSSWMARERHVERSAAGSAAELLTELERAREVLAAADRAARTYLVQRGVIDQTQIDLGAALKTVAEDEEAEAIAR